MSCDYGGSKVCRDYRENSMEKLGYIKKWKERCCDWKNNKNVFSLSMQRNFIIVIYLYLYIYIFYFLIFFYNIGVGDESPALMISKSKLTAICLMK